MNDIPRRTIQDLLSRYELEPSLKDAFVEGEFDQEILTRCCASAKQLQWTVYPISSVDVPPSKLKDNGLTEGNKQRLIALARDLAQTAAECRCIVDRDLDHWFGELEGTRGLRWTEYPSIELYFMSDELLWDVIVVMAKARIANWPEFVSSFVGTLHDLFALRLAARDLDWGLNWISFDRCLSKNGSRIVFDIGDYANRLLLKNSKGHREHEFSTKVSEWRQKLRGDRRDAIRGHDFVVLIAWSVHAYGGLPQFKTEAAIERVFVLIAERAEGVLRLLE